MKPRRDCPGCESTSLSAPFRLPRQPVVLNYRFRDAASASRVPRRDLTLVQCRRCGLIFNATFDTAAIPYDENYENRQSFSPAFTAHLEKLAGEIAARRRLRGAQVLEVGCGKGDFLRLFCALTGARGTGYDTSFEPRDAPEPRGVRFHRHHVTAADITTPFDLVVCRHVIEHVPETGAFLRDLHAIAVAAGDPLVVLETPRVEWIVEQLSLWDVFYEHCNYFPTTTLAHLCRLAGFKVLRQRRAFGAQYQVLELAVARTKRTPQAPGIPKEARLSDFARRAEKHLDALALRFTQESRGRGWAVWGAGAKGVALVNLLRGTRPSCVVDSNPAKQGGVLPGTKIPIVAPLDPRLDRLGLILIANPNYAAEIRAVLKQRGFTGRVLTL
jgi:SAM-dependent methyltransferase